MPAEPSRRRALDAWLLLGVASVGLFAALALPLAPVLAEHTTLTWPAKGHDVESSTVPLAPYRPTDLSATVPCTAVVAALARDGPTTVLATAPDAEGLVLRTQGGRLLLLPGDREIDLVPGGPSCALTVHASQNGVEVGGSTTTPFVLAGPVPKVFAFRTDLSPAEAAGTTATVHVDSPFATHPTGVKLALAVVALLAAAVSLVLLRRASRTVPPRAPPTGAEPSSRRWLLAVDVGVVVLLCGWAVIGPLAVDDGWAATIARTFASTGNPGNYYRWWNAPESPFAFSQELLAPLTQVSLAPLWLRLPSTLLAIATWFVLSRGVLGAALPAVSATTRVRVVAAVFFLAAWLPFNLGTRPESYVAFGLAAVLALTWRARTPADLGWIVLVCVLTAPISPTAVMLAAPVLACLPRAWTILRGAARGRSHLAGLLALLACVGAVALVIVFVDQTWDGLATATRWHTHFGPSLPWYREPDRYAFLLGQGQQGSAGKRAPVLLALALVPAIAALVARRGRGGSASAALRLAGILIGALLLLAVVPSKWSYHLGGAAPLLAAVLTVAVVAVWETAGAKHPAWRDVAVAASCAVVVAAAAAWTFTGSNAWWLPYLYQVPWANRSIRPLGVPLDSFWLWLAVAVVGVAVCALIRNRKVLLAIPMLLALLVAGLSVVVLVGSFVIAPMRRQAASLAMVNVHRLAGGPDCGLADSIEVLADGDPLPSSGPPERLDGFVAMAGFDPDAPPPDSPGTATSAQLWGSRIGLPDNVGQLVSPWFVLPKGTAVSVSVSGQTHGPNALSLEFGRADGTAVTGLGAVAPADPPPIDDGLPAADWRTIGVDAAQIPLGADRVRVNATDGGTGRADWLAVTGPRTTNTVPLNEFLAGRSPTLVSWPLGFVFPCVADIAGITDGVAQMPEVILADTESWLTQTNDESIGGTFAAVLPYGRFHEVRSRVIGHPELRWGAVLMSAEPPGGGVEERRTVRETPWGSGVLHGASDIY